MSFVELNEISSCMKTFQHGLYGVSLILFVSGIFIFYGSYETLHDPLIELTSVDITFLHICFVVATLLLLISFLGSSNKFENPVWIKGYAFLILICLVLQIIVFTQVLKIDSDDMANEIKEKYIMKYSQASPKSKQFIDSIQYDNECCGINNYLDYHLQESKLPRSCCKPSEVTSCTVITVYKKGCRSNIDDYVLTKKTIFFGIFSLTFFIQLLTIIFSVLLSKDLSIQSNA